MDFYFNFTQSMKIKIVTIIALISVYIPALILSRIQRLDAFWYVYQIAYIIGIADSGIISEFNVFGHEALLLILSIITSIKLSSIVFLPIGGCLVFLCAYIFTKSLKTPIIISALFSAYVFLFISSAHGYAVSPWGLSLSLFFLFLFAMSMQQKIHKREYIFIMLLIFVGVHLIYYTIEAFLLVFVIFLYIVYKHPYNAMRRDIGILSVITYATIFLFFNILFYRTFIPSLSNIESFNTLLQPLTQRLGQGALSNSELIYRNPDPTNLIITVAILSIVALPIILFIYNIVITQIRRESQEKNFSVMIRNPLILSLALLSISEVIIYLIRGTLQFRTIIIFGPIVGLFCIKSLYISWQKYSYIYIILILLLMSSYFSFNFVSNPKINRIESVDNSGIWLMHKMDDKTILVDDLYTLGEYRVIAAENGKILNLGSLNELLYSQLIADGQIPYRYFIFNTNTVNYPIYGMEWIQYTPLSKYQTRICHTRNKIYNDGNGTILYL